MGAVSWGRKIRRDLESTWKRRRMTDLKKRVAELAKQNTQLADHLASMCCQADEDCPAEYRTEHFRSTMDDAYDYLREIGYLK